MELPTWRETSVEFALETCFAAGRFATVWALRIRVSDEFSAGGLHKEQSTCLGNCSLSRRPLAEGILDWICHKLDILRFYRLFSGSESLPYGGGIGLGSNIFSRPLTMIAKVSPRFVTSQAKCLLSGFRIGVTIFNDSSGSPSS